MFKKIGISNGVNKATPSGERGSSLIELLIAMGVFVLIVSVIAFLIIDAYVSDRLGKELTQATLLAEEGLEVAKDAGFASVVSVGSELIDKFTRTITVSNVDVDRKQVTSQITWNLTDLRPEEVVLNTYLTNWQAPTSGISYDYAYALRGDSQNDFWRYYISGDSWSVLTNTPNNVKEGGDLVFDGDNYIYAFRGNNKDDFWRYDISGDSWSSMADAPENIKDGGALIYDGSTYIYALRGHDKDDFWRYDISGDSWSSMADAIAKVKDGGDLEFGGSSYIYAFRGDDNDDFWRYDISTDSWVALVNAPDNVGIGSDLTYDNSNYIYAFRGDDNDDFWRYSISGNLWSSLANTPNNIKDGGALVYDSSGYLYAFRGDDKDDFWSYDISGDSWSSLTNTPNNIKDGGALILGSGPVPDETAPANISDLALSGETTNSINLGWTAPGDDGNTGTASIYDIRYSASLIDSGNWSLATQVSGEPIPSVSGSLESMTVSGLSATTTYYFAIKTSDEVPNESGLSNVSSLTTISGITTCSAYCISNSFSSGTCRKNSGKCSKNGETYAPAGDTYCVGGASADTCCCAP